MQRQVGFTLFEITLVMAIIAVLASLAIPNLLAARLAANESSAVSTMRSISTAQAQFQATTKADVDADGVGEFGMFRELAAGVAVRGANDGSAGSAMLHPSILSGAFRMLNANGEISRSGYHFKMFLPGAGGAAVAESVAANDSVDGTLDTELAETTWCTYAWPASYSVGGNRTFFVNQTGDVVSKDDATESGAGAVVPANAGSAFTVGGSLANITGMVAVGTVGADGFIWKRVD